MLYIIIWLLYFFQAPRDDILLFVPRNSTLFLSSGPDVNKTSCTNNKYNFFNMMRVMIIYILYIWSQNKKNKFNNTEYIYNLPTHTYIYILLTQMLFYWVFTVWTKLTI